MQIFGGTNLSQEPLRILVYGFEFNNRVEVYLARMAESVISLPVFVILTGTLCNGSNEFVPRYVMHGGSLPLHPYNGKNHFLELSNSSFV
ncbi:hypothetical protein SK128_006558, partial [Halocaridina rubra]